MTNKLKEKYQKEIVENFRKRSGMKNIAAVPRISKIVVNTGVGKYIKESEAVKEIFGSLKEISGQQPVLTKAKKSVSGFKIRQGQEIGVKVTLRGKRMWDFLEKLISSSLPRIRDFRGIDARNFDKQGNLNLPIKEHIVFPEISAENVKNIFSLQISVINTAGTKEEGIEFFRMLGFPIKSE